MKVLLVSFMSFIIFGLLGCQSKPAVPSCGDSIVQKTAIELSTQHAKEVLTQIALNGLQNHLYSGMPNEYPELKRPDGSLKSIEELSKDAAVAADKMLSTSKFSLDNVRISRTDPDAKKAYCEATLHINNDAIPLSYSAQYNTDGQTHIEIQKFKL